MPETVIAHVVFPRQMLVTMRRCRGHETVAVLDTLPVAMTAISGDEAPVALRNPRGLVEGKPLDIRVREGRFYMPVDLGRHAGGTTPEVYGALLSERLGFHHGMGVDRGGRQRWDLADWKSYFVGVNRKRPLVPESELDIQAVHSDGRAERARMIETVGRDWLLVDGRLHQRVEEPCYAMGGFDSGGIWLNPIMPLEHDEDPAYAPPGYERFRADRAEDAIAFGRAWAEVHPCVPVTDCERFEILRPDLLASAASPDSAGAMALAHLRTVLQAAASCIGHCDDDTVARFLALRRVASGQDPDPAGAERAMAGLHRLVKDVAGAEAASGWRAKDAFSRLATEARLAFLRHDAIDRPRLEQAEDAADLAVLAP